MKSANKSEIIDIIPAGKIKCFITGKMRKDTPEERIRQDVSRSLVEEYGYNKENIDIEFPVKMGRARKRIDIVIFNEGSEHKQENIYTIVEVKTENVRIMRIKQLNDLLRLKGKFLTGSFQGVEDD